MIWPAVKALPRRIGLGAGGELNLQRFWICQPLVEGGDPPFQRLARDRAGAELMVPLLIEEAAATVPGQLVPGAGELLESDSGDPKDSTLSP
jgi:hypothetical protein